MKLTPADIRPALLRPADLQLASPDAHLLSLRNALLDAWDTEVMLYSERNPQWSAASDERAALARQMIEMRAYTLAGLQAKAIALASCVWGDDEEDIRFSDQQTTDVRLAQSIVMDLLRG